MSDHPKVHVFICEHKKDNGKASCGHNSNIDPSELKKELKTYCKEKWAKSVRINTAGCLGKCSMGAAAVIYPQGKWYLKMDKNSLNEILKDIKSSL